MECPFWGWSNSYPNKYTMTFQVIVRKKFRTLENLLEAFYIFSIMYRKINFSCTGFGNAEKCNFGLNQPKGSRKKVRFSGQSTKALSPPSLGLVDKITFSSSFSFLKWPESDFDIFFPHNFWTNKAIFCRQIFQETC